MNREIYKFLNDVISTKPSIAIIIDERTAELDEVLGVLPLKAEIIELRTFEREGIGLNVHGHLLSSEETIEEEKERKKYPEHMLSWEARLEWVAPEIKELANKLIRKVESLLAGTSGEPKYRWYYLYKGTGRRLDSLFAVLMIKKKKVSVRIKVDPAKFKDELKWTSKYKGWFFTKKYEEREFSISTPEQLDYALELMKQSYGISGE